MVRCAASWCDVSSTESSAKFFKFPDEEDSRVDAWKDFAEIEGETTGLVLCSDHFAPCYLDKNGDITSIAIPTIWKKAADADSTEIALPNTPEKLVFRVISAPTKEGDRSDVLSRENYLSNLLTSSSVGVEKKMSLSETKPQTSTPKPMHLLMGSTAIRGPPKLKPPTIGHARIIAGAKPRIVRINPDPLLANKIKESSISIRNAKSSSADLQTQHKESDSSLLGEFLTFSKSDEGEQVDNADDDEVIEEQMEAEEEFVMEQEAEEEQIIDDDDEIMEVDEDLSNLTDQQKAVRPQKSSLAATEPLESSAVASGKPSSTPKLTAKAPISPKPKAKGINIPSSATVVKLKSPVEMPSVVNIDKLPRKRRAPDFVRYRSTINPSDNVPNADPKITPCRVELNIKPSDDVEKLTADLVLTPDVPRGAKELLQNTIEMKSREEGRLLVTRVYSDHVCYRDVVLPILPSPIEVHVETSMLRSLAGKKLVKNPIVKFFPDHSGPSPFKAGGQRPVYATQIQLNETGLMTINCCLVPIAMQKKKTAVTKSPAKRGRPRKKVKPETPDTDEDEDIFMQLDDDYDEDQEEKPSENPTDSSQEVKIQVPSYSGPVNAEGSVLDFVRRKLKEYLKSNPDISTVLVIPADQSDILGDPSDDKSSSEDEEENDSVAQNEEGRRELRRLLSLAMKPPKRLYTSAFGLPLVSVVSCKRQVHKEMSDFSKHLAKVASL